MEPVDAVDERKVEMAVAKTSRFLGISTMKRIRVHAKQSPRQRT